MHNRVSPQGEFYWFHGVVEDIDDPLKLGRVKIRALEIHNPDKNILPTSSLPWAIVAMPPTSASMKGIGQSSTGLLVGSWVLGFFRDGASKQDPVVMSSIPSRTDGVDDIPAEAKDGYPHHHVIHTSSGHVIEYTDSGDTYIKVTHSSGKAITIDGTNISITGDLVVSGTVTASDATLAGKVFSTHVHSGVTSGASNTGAPA